MLWAKGSAGEAGERTGSEDWACQVGKFIYREMRPVTNTFLTVFSLNGERLIVVLIVIV